MKRKRSKEACPPSSIQAKKRQKRDCQVILKHHQGKFAIPCQLRFLNNYNGVLDKACQALKDKPELIVGDFAPQSCLLHYVDYENYEILGNVPLAQVTCTDERKMIYLKGYLERENEIAVIPMGEHFQMFLFSVGKDDTDPSFQAIVIPKFNFILDLDDTLVRCRPVEHNVEPNKKAHEHLMKVSMNVQDGNGVAHKGTVNFLCTCRPWILEFLEWASVCFRIIVITNATWHYATEVIKILDPERKTLLRNIDPDKPESLSQLIKSREFLKQVEFINAKNNEKLTCGVKELSRFSLNAYTSVIFDDDQNVWSPSNRINLLPFQDVTKYSDPKQFISNMKDKVWHQFSILNFLRRKQCLALQATGSAIAINAEMAPKKTSPQSTSPQGKQQFATLTACQ